MVAHSGSVVSPCARLEGIADIGVVDVARAGGLVGSLSLDKLAEGLAFSPAGRQHNPCRRRTCSTCGHAPGTGDALDAAGGRPPQRCTDRDLRSMLAEMQRLDPNAPTVAARSRLHLALVRPLHSRVFSEFLRLFWTITNGTIRLYARAPQTVIAIEHQRIVAAIAARDATAAVAAVRDHLDHLAEAIRSRYLPMDR